MIKSKITTTATTLTVAENSGATPIGIPAPVDNKYSSSQLTVTIKALPTDGSIYLAGGTTAVTVGEKLTVAQLTGLTFTPITGDFSQSSSLSYKVTDPSGASATGSATLAIGPATTTTSSTAPTTTPASLTVAENAAATAIGITAPTDPSYSASQLTVTVNALPNDGTIYLADGTTAVTVGESLSVTQLTGLTFKPTTGLSSQSSGFSYKVTDPTGASATGSATLAIAAAATGGMVFHNTFGPGVSAAYQSCVLSAEAQLSSQWTNPVTLNLTFDAVSQAGGFAATNTCSFVNVSYAQLKSALTAHATSTYAQSAIAALPASDPNPAGGTDWALPEAYARMLGLSSTTPSTDATITLNTYYGWSYGQDVINTLEHEIAEGAMGRIGGLGDQNGVWSTMDLFRYNAAGKPDYTDGRDGLTTYFSYNGGVTTSAAAGLSFSNQYSGSTKVNGNDVADFTQQDVFGLQALGETNVFSQTDLQIMDVLGWNPAGTSAAGVVVASGSSTTGSTGTSAASAPDNLALLRNYMASSFVPSGMGQGGPLTNEPPFPSFQPLSLTNPHHT